MESTVAFAGELTPYGCLPEWRSCVVSSGMPLIPPIFDHAACFLYHDAARADKNERSGGTAFLVGIRLPTISERVGKNIFYPVAISNRHVVKDGGAPVIRLNKSGGGKVIIDLTDRDWIAHPDGVDLAIAPLFEKVDWPTTEHSFCPLNNVLTTEVASKIKLGLGDEVFMIGRFMNHQGTEDYIRPAVRFGTISMMPEQIKYKGIAKPQLGFAVEMRSKKGFSGSPVIVYRTPNTNLSDDKSTHIDFDFLLGINIGFINDEEAEEGEDANTWLNGVIPAWFIYDILETDEMKRRLIEADCFGDGEASTTIHAAEIASKSALSAKADNPQHKEDFNRLLASVAPEK